MLEGLQLSTTAPVTLLVGVVLGLISAIWTGKLIPISWIESRFKDRDRLDAARDARIVTLEDYIETVKKNNDVLLEQGRETTRVIRALPQGPINTEGP
jgi:hypothetical protein